MLGSAGGITAFMQIPSGGTRAAGPKAGALPVHVTSPAGFRNSGSALREEAGHGVHCLPASPGRHYSFRCSEELEGFAKPQVPSKHSLQALPQCRGNVMRQPERALESLDKAAGQVN